MLTFHTYLCFKSKVDYIKHNKYLLMVDMEKHNFENLLTLKHPLMTCVASIVHAHCDRLYDATLTRYLDISIVDDVNLAYISY